MLRFQRPHAAVGCDPGMRQLLDQIMAHLRIQIWVIRGVHGALKGHSNTIHPGIVGVGKPFFRQSTNRVVEAGSQRRTFAWATAQRNAFEYRILSVRACGMILNIQQCLACSRCLQTLPDFGGENLQSTPKSFTTTRTTKNPQSKATAHPDARRHHSRITARVTRAILRSENSSIWRWGLVHSIKRHNKPGAEDLPRPQSTIRGRSEIHG